ncbi:MAG: response regulator transcription factor [Acidobacteriaceae bacterium]|nr:response regulator transcription factor [Acidobacteriaceae bacterium]
MPVRILIADDDPPIRRLLRRLVEQHTDWKICGEAENGRDAIQRTKQLAPDVVIIDLAMPQMNGLQAGREIFKSSQVPMLLLTVQDVSPELAKEAKKAGFLGALSKSRGSEVIHGIETLLRHQSFFPASP